MWTTNFFKSNSKNILLYMSSRLSKIRSVHTHVMPRTIYFGWICTSKLILKLCAFVMDCRHFPFISIDFFMIWPPSLMSRNFEGLIRHIYFLIKAIFLKTLIKFEKYSKMMKAMFNFTVSITLYPSRLFNIFLKNKTFISPFCSWKEWSVYLRNKSSLEKS